MHFKAGLIAAVAAASSSLVSAEQVGQNQINIHRQFKVNDQICVTKQPITFCNAGFKPIYEQENLRSVEMLCLDEAHPMANQMSQIMETGHRQRSLQQEAEKRTLQVPKVIRCQTARLTKQGEIEDNTQVSNKGLRKQFENKREREQYYETIRAEQKEQLKQLHKLMPSVEKAVALTESEYEEAYKNLIKIVRKDEQIEGPLFMLSNYLPQAYVQAVHRFQHELISENMEETEKRQVSEQLKKLASRVYVYTLTRLVQEQHKQPISEQLETSFNNWEHFEQHFERLWSQIKREMDNEKIVKTIERQVERKFQKKITEEQKQQLQSWELNLQKNIKENRENEREQQEWERRQPQEWETKMTREQRERQQQTLTKILMAGLKTVEVVEKEQKEQKSGSPLLSGLFKGQKAHYEQLIQQFKNKFQNYEY